MNTLVPPATGARRLDLDWLRVIAFALLIFYHVGMFYVTWGWHVKSTHASPALEPVMALLNPWRLALLFFISGVAVRFALDKTATLGFIGERTGRLLVPLVFGMAVIVMPQAYVELLGKGEIEPGILAFWPHYLEIPGTFSIITPTWNHLWYVAYVLVYTLLVALAAPALNRLAGPVRRLAAAMAADRTGLLLLAAALPFLLYRAVLDPLFPTTHALVDDWANHAHSLTIFVYGYLIAREPAFWRAIERHWPKALGLAAIIGIAIVAARLNWPAVRANDALLQTMLLLRALYAWAIILALLGMAQRWLNRPGRTLTYLTQAIFPYYILHQTLIVVIGWSLRDAGLPVLVEASLVVSGTVIGCVAGYELIHRSGPLRPLLGLRRHEKAAPAGSAAPGAGPVPGSHRPVTARRGPLSS